MASWDSRANVGRKRHALHFLACGRRHQGRTVTLRLSKLCEVVSVRPLGSADAEGHHLALLTDRARMNELHQPPSIH